MVTNLMKYNPAFLGDEVLIRSFVARTSELERILEVLQENTTGSNQHLLVIGPRGIGKTTLVLRAAAEIRADPALGAHWYPVVYGEETYQVSSAGEFWLEALFHVGQQTEDARWKQAHEDLLGERNEKRLRPRALAQLMDFADKQGKRLVLVVENLNMLFGGQIGDEDAWVLRHTLMNEPRIMLIGTATSRFRVMDEYNQALYELFRIMELEPLADEDAHAVWTAATGQTVPRHQLRPIQILTGGNPRLIRILSEFAAKTSFRSLMDDLTRLVDEHTEYFKHHLDNLAPQERKVFVVLADLWDPSTTRQVSEAARLDVNVTSVQLKRLVDRGAVTMPKKHGRTQFYQVAERMYNIYHLMRRRGQPSSRVHAVVRFMVSLYRDEELIRTTRSLAEEAARLTADQRREHFQVYEAILTHTREPQIAEQLIAAGRLVFQAMPDAPESLLRLLAPESPPVPHHLTQPEQTANEDLVSPLLNAPERAVAAEEALRRVLETDPKNENAWYQLGILLTNQPDRLEEALEAFDHLVALDETVANAWANKGTTLRQLGRAAESLHAYERALTLDAANRVAWAGKAAVLTDLGRTAEALEALDRVVALDTGSSWAWAARGVALAQLGHPAEALEALDRALALEPGFAEAWHNRGSVLEVLGQYPEALECYNRVLRLNSDHAAAWAGQAAVLLRIGRPREALESFDRALSLQPGAAVTYNNRGVALRQLGQTEEALESYERALRLDTEEAATWHNKGGVLLELGRTGEALEAFERSLSLDVHDTDSWINKASTLGRLGRLEEALEAYNRALELNVASAVAWTGRGAVLGQLGRVEEAMDALERAVVVDEHSADVWSNMGALNGRLGRPEKALEAFDRAVTLAPQHRVAWMGKGGALAILGRIEEAMESFDRAVSLDAEDATVWTTRGIALRQFGRMEEALESFDRALALEPEDTAAWTNRGAALGQLGRAEEALKSIDRALALEPEDATAWTNRGAALVGLSRAEEALASFDRALSLEPDDVAAWANRGGALVQLGNAEEALASLDRALTLDSESAPAWQNRSFALLDLGRTEEALESFEHALTLPPSTNLTYSGATPGALDTMAWAMFAEGPREKLPVAENWAQHAVEQVPENGSARHTLACILGAQGRWKQALNEAAVFLRDHELLDSDLDLIIDFFIDAAASGHADEVERVIRTAGAEDALEPLLVAIRRLSGEQVDIAREILEISTDVIERIETRRRELQEG